MGPEFVPLLTERMLAHARDGLFDMKPIHARDSTGHGGYVGKCSGQNCQHRGKLYGGPDVCVTCWWSTGR